VEARRWSCIGLSTAPAFEFWHLAIAIVLTGTPLVAARDLPVRALALLLRSDRMPAERAKGWYPTRGRP